MKKILNTLVWILIFGLPSCEKDDNIKLYLDSIDSNKYYSSEIIPTDYLNIYGKWRLFQVSGGFSGTGHEPDYDYLEIKSFGIYGLIKNDTLFEYGKIELANFDTKTEGYLQIKLIPEFLDGKNPRMSPSEKYVELVGSDSLNLLSPCCDWYNYHYKKK